MFRDRFLQIGRDKRFDNDGAGGVLLVEHAELEKRLRPVVGEERTDLIAREQFHLAARGPDRDAHSIAIRIRRDDQVGAFSSPPAPRRA